MKSNYTVEELIENPSFRRMAKGEADSQEVSRWDRWMEANGEHRRKAKQAMAEITSFEFKDPPPPDMAAEWDRLREVTVVKKRNKVSASRPKSNGLQWLYRVAAILLLGVLAGGGFYIYSNSNQTQSQKQITRKKTIKAGPSEQITLTFAGGGQITLNNHTTLRYWRSKSSGQPIKIELQGEAYFQTAGGKIGFVVHTPDGVIRDIGTKFLVAVQPNRSRVVVQEGKVKINLKNKGASSSNMVAKEGEMLSFNRSHILSEKAVNPTYYTSWATGFMQLDQMPLRKFAGFLEQRFNVNVKFTDPELDGIKISGSIYFESLPELVKAISKVAMIPAYQSKDGKTVYLGNKYNEKFKSHE